MARGAAIAAAVAVLLAALAVAGLACAAGGSGGRPARPGPPPRVFAFVSDLGGAELARLRSVGARIDVVAPNWYELTDLAGGTLRAPHAGRASRLQEVARSRGVAVWPVVNGRTGGSGAWTAPAARARIAAALAGVAAAPGHAGVTLDLEELRPDQRAAFTALVRQTAARVHAAGRRLAVYVPRGAGGAYDWRALAERADLLLASGYNEHWAGGAPGPITTSAGFDDVLDRGLAAAGPRRLAPVLGAFGYRWSAPGRGRLISSADGEARRRARGGAARRADGAVRFRDGSATVVYESASGLRRRAAAARAAGARWIALFSLGREPVTFWPGLRTARSVRAQPSVPNLHGTSTTPPPPAPEVQR